MPKLKTHSGTAKRFKKTKSGKVKRARAGRRHILSTKTKSQKRKLRTAAYVEETHAVHMQQLLPYG
ncbi:MAG: 50S ribosomal protein L35 [Deltaproteobacteria bacterium CG11_big_fil_rev_8_21_14_0_20_47_16]|nr:MAG: 50S ribosomal protein L35 [Deltaproteobacteria bacterium CG11_big_fil_rev_8_21_14_0_20_47_16]